jgi:hypothetical protein
LDRSNLPYDIREDCLITQPDHQSGWSYNSLWGKFAQRDNFTKVEYLSKFGELQDILNNDCNDATYFNFYQATEIKGGRETGLARRDETRKSPRKSETRRDEAKK